MRRIGATACVVGLATLCATGAAAKTVSGGLITIGRTASPGGLQLYVDTKGTVSALYTTETSGGENTLAYLRKPAGASKFTSVALPGVVAGTSSESALIYEPAAGALEIVAGNFNQIEGWYSTNDGTSWTAMNTTALNSLSSNGIYIDPGIMTAAPGGPVGYAGDTGDTGPVVQLNPQLTSATTVLTAAQGVLRPLAVRAAYGASYLVGSPDGADTGPSTVLDVQEGTTSTTATFPCAAQSAVGAGEDALAAGASNAVLAFTGCGHAWTRTISATGAVGPLVTLGSAPTGEESGYVALVGSGSGHYTAAWTVVGGDLAVAHSTGGTSWTHAAGYVPIAPGPDINDDRAVAGGAATWYGDQIEGSDNGAYDVDGVPFSDTYRPPKAPSGAGIRSPRHASLGSMSVTLPGKVAARSFNSSGKVTLRVVGAVADTATVSVEDQRVKGETTYDICAADTTVHLTPGAVHTVTLTCAGEGVTLGVPGGGGGGSTKTDLGVAKGDTITFTIAGRNGSITVPEHLS